MTVTSGETRREYSGDGATVAFPYPYRFLAAADLKVVLTAANGTETVQQLTTHYTVTGAGLAAGGTVTMVTAPTTGTKLNIVNDLAHTQGLDLVENDSLPAEDLETAIDRNTMGLKRLRDLISRSLRLSDGDAGGRDMTLPPKIDSIGKILTFDANGEPTASNVSALVQGLPTNAAVYLTVAVMKASSPTDGDWLLTKGYHTAGDKGAAIYLVKTAAAYAATPNEYGDHTLANGNVAVLQRPGPLNICQFGAKGDGVADDTSAIQAALNTAAVSIYVPRGRYRVLASLTRTGHTYLHGDTMTSAVWQMEGSASFVFSGGAAGNEYDTYQLHIERLSFECPTLVMKDVIAAAWIDGIGGTSKTFIMRDCEITGTAAAGGFRDAVKLTNARNVVVESVRILGDRDGTPLGSEKGFNIAGEDPNGAPVELFFNNVQVFFVQKAFDINGWVEGVYFNNITAVACHRGITGLASGSKPWISVLGSHLNTDVFGIQTVGFVQVNIAHNLIYGQDIDGTTAGYTGVHLDCGADTLDAQIVDNHIRGFLTGVPKNGITLVNGAGSDRALIDGNLIVAFDTGVWLETGTTDVVVSDANMFVACTTNILDQGSNTVCRATLSATDGHKMHPDGLTQKWGSQVVTLNAAGDGSLALTPAFKTAFLTGLVCNGDPGTAGNAVFCVNQTACSTTNLSFSVRPNPGAINVRVNWSASGH